MKTSWKEGIYYYNRSRAKWENFAYLVKPFYNNQRKELT